MNKSGDKNMSEKSAPLLEHLNELRKVLIAVVIALVLGTIVCYAFFMEQTMALVTAPIESLGQQLYFTNVTEGFMTHLRVAVMGGCIIASPVIIWQILRFILPALYKHERRMFFAILFFGILLFVGGIAFGYVFVLTLGLNAMIFTFSGDLQPLLRSSEYVSFILSFLLPFGLVFEIPLFVYFLTKLGIITPKLLREKRKYIILIILILAAVLTPPDVISQMLIATPMLILYEISIWLSSIVYKRKLKKEAKKQQSYDE